MKPRRFCKLLKDALKDEREAKKEYKKLIKEAWKVLNRATVAEIQDIADDEAKHGDFLEELFKDHCG